VEVRSRKAEESASFLKKRSKKLLLTAGLGNEVAKARQSKSFLVTFFQKSNFLLPKACP
jgi:hypothetical protein